MAKGVKPRSIRVLLVDDHPVLRAGVRAYLAGRGIEVVGEASDAAQALRAAAALAPDVIVLDVNLPVVDGGELARLLRVRVPGSQLVAFSIHGGAEYATRMARCGVRAYVTKEQPAADLLAAIVRAARSRLLRSRPRRTPHRRGAREEL